MAQNSRSASLTLVGVAALLGCMPMAASASTPVLGIAKAQDGDSLEVAGVRVRLFGIDAPEYRQQCNRGGTQWACGIESANQLAALVDGKQVRCGRLGIDQYGRVLAKCFLDGFEINRMMVERGYATAFRKYSSDYIASENRAKEAGLGIWASSFEEPSDVRNANRGPAHRSSDTPARSNRIQSLSGAPGSCTIKGNHSRKGEWIYHLPGMPYYNQTRAEAMFCSEAEARAAGYRRARTPR